MKKIFLVLLLIISISAQSQVLITLLLGDKLNSDGLEFGLEGGMNWTTISGFESKNLAQKWNLGFYFNIRIKNNLSLYTGVLVKANNGLDELTNKDLSTLGISKYKDQTGQELEGAYSQKLSTFMIPALIRYNFKNHMFIAAGPQFGLIYKSWVEFNSDIDGKDASIKDYNKDLINKIDVGVSGALGYRMMKGTGWTISAKYYYGFVDVFKSIPGTKNSSIFIELNIPIGAGEKPEESK